MYGIIDAPLNAEWAVDENTYIAFVQAKQVEAEGVIAVAESFLANLPQQTVGKKKCRVIRQALLAQDQQKHHQFLDEFRKHNLKFSNPPKKAKKPSKLSLEDQAFLERESASGAEKRAQKNFSSDRNGILARVDRIEQEDPTTVSVYALDKLAKDIQKSSHLSVGLKIKLLTKLDKKYLQRIQALQLTCKSKQYCHKFRLANGLTDEDPKGYGSLCIGHSRRAR